MSVNNFVATILTEKQNTAHIVSILAIVFNVVLQVVNKGFHFFDIPHIGALIIGYFDKILILKFKNLFKHCGSSYYIFFHCPFPQIKIF